MTRVLHLLTLAAALLSAAAGLGAERGDRLAVLTYNIQIGTGMDKKIDLERTAAVIRRTAPDVVALQEVDRKARRTRGTDQAVELARLTGMHMAFGKASVREGIDEDGGDYGNAILSRFPIRRSQNRALPYTRGFELRAVLEAEIDWRTQSGRRIPLRFFGTHFDNASEADRIASAKMLNELARSGGEQPTVLAGDLNAAPESEPVKILAGEWRFAVPLGGAPTFPASTPRRQIDYVLYRPEGKWRVIDAKVVEEPLASDHRPVLVVLEYAGPAL